MPKKEEWMGEISIQKYLTEIKSSLRELVGPTVIFAPGACRPQVRTGPIWTISADAGDAADEFRDFNF